MKDITSILKEDNPCIKIGENCILTLKDDLLSVLKMQEILRRQGDDHQNLKEAMEVILGEDAQKLKNLSYGNYLKVCTCIIAEVSGVDDNGRQK